MTRSSVRTESPAVLLQAAAEVAQYAAKIAMQWYRTDVSVEIKGDGSPVTIVTTRLETETAWSA